MSTGPTAGKALYKAGAKNSALRLEHLGFNPIDNLVFNYRRLELELERQEKIREGLIVELTSTGRPRAYNPEAHMAVYDRLIMISERLLRYRYGRVPELGEDEKKKAAGTLVVQLTKKGDVYTINGDKPTDMPDFPMGEVREGDLPRPALIVQEADE